MDKMHKEKLLKQITVMDFMATDLHLYLNTHPTDTEALCMFNDVAARSAEARQEYEKLFGPLTGFRTQDIAGNGPSAGWRWNHCPWPWEASANFSWDEKMEPAPPMPAAPVPAPPHAFTTPASYHGKECL